MKSECFFGNCIWSQSACFPSCCGVRSCFWAARCWFGYFIPRSGIYIYISLFHSHLFLSSSAILWELWSLEFVCLPFWFLSFCLLGVLANQNILGGWVGGVGIWNRRTVWSRTSQVDGLAPTRLDDVGVWWDDNWVFFRFRSRSYFSNRINILSATLFSIFISILLPSVSGSE